jgi:hypothetical protein
MVPESVATLIELQPGTMLENIRFIEPGIGFFNTEYGTMIIGSAPGMYLVVHRQLCVQLGGKDCLRFRRESAETHAFPAVFS